MTNPTGRAMTDVLTLISDQPLSLDRALAEVSVPEVGGVGIFVGLVRDHDEGRSVTALSYSAHPSAADRLADTVRTVAAEHEVVRVWVAHRIGDLAVGDPAVVVAVGAAHRGPALACCRELIDRLKVEVPIWKEQSYTGGGVSWVGV